MPAIIGILVAGQLSGHRLDGLIAGRGAITVGFGAFQHLTRLRAGPMLLAADAAHRALATLIGGLVGVAGQLAIRAADPEGD